MYTCIYGISGKVSHLSHPIPSCPIPSRSIPSCMGQMVAIGAGLGQLFHMVHQCIQTYIWHLRQGVPLVPSCPVPSHPVPSRPVLSSPEWANWWLLVLAWDNWSTWSINICAYIWHLRQGVLLVPSCPILSRPIPSCAVLSCPVLS